MKMSSLIDSTFRSLAQRLQRGGTTVTTTGRPTAEAYRWVFDVHTPGVEPKVAVTVEVKLLTNNVYKNDKVCIVVSGIHSVTPSHTMSPVSGNCPPLDSVEAFIRKSLAEKQALPKSTTVVEEVKPEPVQDDHPPEVDPVSPLNRKQRRHRRHESQEPAQEPSVE